ncbi:hypothetical protein HAX54_030844 [Datura stramonium]|uniref:Uncharacterized protein n=1 Tax=Datura stramonium TaxID=4076 RepID=A0ABS8VBQ3_DATST|nr:hypothetical protein [Datura stramonium]
MSAQDMMSRHRGANDSFDSSSWESSNSHSAAASFDPLKQRCCLGSLKKPAGGLEARLVSINAISSGGLKAAIIVPEESFSNKGDGRHSCEDKGSGKNKDPRFHLCCRRGKNFQWPAINVAGTGRKLCKEKNEE